MSLVDRSGARAEIAGRDTNRAAYVQTLLRRWHRRRPYRLRCVAAFVLRELGGMSYREIALALRLSDHARALRNARVARSGLAHAAPPPPPRRPRETPCADDEPY